jgi:hypothetical protein
MKKFSESLNEQVNPYPASDLRSKLYELVQQKLQVVEGSSITGQKELVEKLYSLLTKESIKEEIKILEGLKESFLY